MKPTRSRPIPAPLYLSNFPPSPIKSRNATRNRADSSKGSGASRFPDSVGNMYSINGLGDMPREVRSSFVDMVKSLQTSQSGSCCGRFFGKCLLSISGFFDMLYSLQEPDRKGCLANFVKSQGFGMMSTAVILANAVFIFFATDYEMHHIGETTPVFIRVTDMVLSSCYVVEVLLKLLVHRGFFFWNIEWAWNWFDFLLILFSIMENLLSYEVVPSSRTGDPVNLGFLRLLRLCKIATERKVTPLLGILRHTGRGLHVQDTGCNNITFDATCCEKQPQSFRVWHVGVWPEWNYPQQPIASPNYRWMVHKSYPKAMRWASAYWHIPLFTSPLR